MIHKYPLYRAYIGISNRGMLGSGYIQLSPEYSHQHFSLVRRRASVPGFYRQLDAGMMEDFHDLREELWVLVERS